MSSKIKLCYMYEYNGKEVSIPPVLQLECSCGKTHNYLLGDGCEYDTFQTDKYIKYLEKFRLWSKAKYGIDLLERFDKEMVTILCEELEYETKVQDEINQVLKEIGL